MTFQPDCGIKADVIPSPNFGDRKSDKVDMILLHYTATETAHIAQQWLCNPDSNVSAHYLINEAGVITQMVSERHRAWHAGLSLWEGISDTNSRSIGIEIQHCGDQDTPFPKKQINSLIHLLADILKRHQIAPHRVLAHSDVAPGRKQDPGRSFPWDALAYAGIGHYVPPHPILAGPFLQQGDEGQAVEALQALLGLYGYGIDIKGQYDQITYDVVTAFQRHFRQEKVDGIADRSTLETLNALLQARKKFLA